MSRSVVEPLRDEHRELRPHIDELRTAADEVDRAGLRAAGPAIEAAVRFLEHHLIPHAEAEDAALYPVVERVLGATGATATMRRDHVEVRRLTEELATVARALRDGDDTAAVASAARRLLYGLHAVVSLHFAKEEEVYLPLLEQSLTADEAAEMFTAMEAAAATSHHHH